jgi:hypothetical protein
MCEECSDILSFLLFDLHLDSDGPTPVYNDNRVAVDWSHSFSTKGMRHLNIRENAVHESPFSPRSFHLSYLRQM